MPEIQQPDILGNYLTNYRQAQQFGQQQQDRQRQIEQQDKLGQQQDTTFAQTTDLNKLKLMHERASALNEIVGRVPDGDAQGLEGAKQQAIQLGIPPEMVSRVTVADLPRIRMETGQTLQQLEIQMKKAQIAAQYSGVRANDAQAAKYRADAANVGTGGGGHQAPQGYQWVRAADGSVALAPITGGPADVNRIAPGEGVKIRASNAQLDALEQSLNSYISNLDKTSALGRVVSRGPEVSRVETGHTDLLMQMKNLYELGVLNGPDYMLMTKIVEDPTSMMQLARGTDGLKAQTDTVKSIIARSRNINNAKLGLPPNAAPPPTGTSSVPDWAR